ncbi:sporulation protein YabP [Clostridium aestuarii]|uniref:Sporulation protein YabP n=1 Tax=Clostridium aestuarii TaxID=338193 RepID=A0ABT4D3A7_9CLOT|nr:sporulation protein YabP [Clostridium aestuarii]MCY6485714.1 sporulation protein YabP [Clostridium aestuarii]
MEVKKENVQNKESNLKIENRKKLILTGVVEVISFDDTNIVLDTTLGKLTIKGKELKMNKLDVQNGDVIILGQVDSCIYTTIESKKDRESIIAKLFR